MPFNSTPKTRRPIRTVLLTGLILLALVTAGLALLKPLTGHDYIKDFFLYQIEQQLGRKLDVRVVRLVVFPSIRLELKDAVVFEADGTTPFVRAERIDAVLRFWPLLQRQVIGKRLLVERPDIVLRRDKVGAWNVAALAPAASAIGAGGHRPTDWLMYMKETTIKAGTVRIVDDGRPDGTRTVEFQALTAGVVIDAARERGDLTVTATVPTDPGVSSFALSGTAVQVPNPARFSSDDPSQVASVIQFDGTMQATNLSVRQVADLLGPAAAAGRTHGPARSERAGSSRAGCGRL